MGRSMELGANWGSRVHKNQLSKKKIILESAAYCLRYPENLKRATVESWLENGQGWNIPIHGRKPISLSAGSTVNSFIIPSWLCSGLTLFQDSENVENSGPSPSLPGQVDCGFLEGICDLASQPGWQCLNSHPSGDITTVPRWRSACPTASRGSWSCLFPSAVSISPNEAILTTKEMALRIQWCNCEPIKDFRRLQQITCTTTTLDRNYSVAPNWFLPQPHSSSIHSDTNLSFLIYKSYCLVCACVCVCVCARVRSGASVKSNSLQPHGPQPMRLLCPWHFSGQEY